MKGFPAHLILSLYLALPISQPVAAEFPSNSAQGNGRLFGQVIDGGGDPIASVCIIFSGESIALRAVADEHGKNGIELPAGEYRVQVTIPGFSPFHRAKIRVPADTTKLLNIVPAFGGFTCVLDVTGKERDPYKEGLGPPQYEKLSLLQLSGMREELVVRFQLKKEQGHVVEYRGGQTNRNVMLSHNLIAIYAEKLRFDKEQGTIEAQGRVIVEDGEHRRRFKYAKLEVRDRTVLLTTDRSKVLR